MAQGRWLLQDRQLMTLDWEDIKDQTRRWSRKINS
jgi:hypothetical protein